MQCSASAGSRAGSGGAGSGNARLVAQDLQIPLRVRHRMVRDRVRDTVEVNVPAADGADAHPEIVRLVHEVVPNSPAALEYNHRLKTKQCSVANCSHSACSGKISGQITVRAAPASPACTCRQHCSGGMPD